MERDRQARSNAGPGISVRTGKGYNIDFVVDLGQRNATIRRGALTPLRRVVGWGGAVTAIPERDIDLVHTFNAVPLTRRPHLITFEDYLPRTPPDTRGGLPQRALRRLLHRRECVRLLAMSQYATRQFRWQNRNYAGLRALEEKLELLYPAVALRASVPKRRGDVLRLLFVGRDHMRKGLPALLDAHRVLAGGGVPVRTSVVSALQWAADDYIGPPDERMVTATRAAMSQDGITHHGSLPNAAVLDLLRTADFLVFPTLHDTFGYVALEAMATGTPVIATDTASLPEMIDHGMSGYLLPIENDAQVGKWVGTYQREDPAYADLYWQTVQRLGGDLADQLGAAWEEPPETYEAMSAAALHTVRTRFDRTAARDRLEALYEESVRLL